jgi:hypothetical protein
MAQQETFGRRPPPASAARSSAQPARSFGQSASDQSPPPSEGIFARARAEAAAAAKLALLPEYTGDKAVDDELAEWKAARKSAFKLPWRQLSLMASLCFGLASFVLPDTVNDAVNWVLYALMGISFVVGVTGRKKAKA